MEGQIFIHVEITQLRPDSSVGDIHGMAHDDPHNGIILLRRNLSLLILISFLY
jgi:hypothetical protein